MRSATETAARSGTPAAADATLKVLEDHQMRERFARAMATPEIQRAMEELSGGLAAGVVRGLTSEELTAHMTRLVGQFTRAMMSALAEGMTFSASHEASVERFAGAMTQAVLRSAAREIPESLAPAMHEAITNDLGPAMKEAMHKDLAPGIAALMKSPDVQSAFAETSREVARQAVLGSNEALAELTEKRKRDEGGTPLGSIGTFFAGRTWLLAFIVAVAVFSVPLFWLLRDRRAARRYREDAERRTNRAAALLGAMEAGGDAAWSSKLLALLREQLLQEATDTDPKHLERNEPPPPLHGPGDQRARHA